MENEKDFLIEYKVLVSENTYKKEIYKLSKEEVLDDLDFTKGTNVYELDFFWELRDQLFESIILKSFERPLKDFFHKIHTDQFNYKIASEKGSLKVINLWYNIYPYEVYLFVEPNPDYFTEDKIERIELSLHFDLSEFENLLTQILDLRKIDYSNLDDSLANHELEKDDYIQNLIYQHWSLVKKETNSSLIGFLSLATGGCNYFDLDNQNSIECLTGEIKKYLDQKNVNIKSEVS
ncbi:hypothetical protein [Tenacibaculum amylolyticum]|uniref:hypothetical protein n=1 Tax=Tenacibaculum amylolyticum TaxID=104269 RepID=UPI0038957673